METRSSRIKAGNELPLICRNVLEFVEIKLDELQNDLLGRPFGTAVVKVTKALV